jgi:hypothetical protein
MKQCKPYDVDPLLKKALKEWKKQDEVTSKTTGKP